MIADGSAARPEATPPEPLPLKKSVSRPLSGLRRNTPSDNGNEIWFLTLSDLLLLLVIFFVLLFGLSWQQQNQHRPAAAAAEPNVLTRPVPPAAAAEAYPAPPVSSLEKELTESLGTAALPGVTVESRGPVVVLTFPERIVFDTGEARLKPEADPILAEVGTFITRRGELQVEVHGHTDDRPIRNARYPSNWELSADRATQVARALITQGAEPRQVSVKGFGPYRPLAPNDSESNRSGNRRVEIHFTLPGAAAYLS